MRNPSWTRFPIVCVALIAGSSVVGAQNVTPFDLPQAPDSAKQLTPDGPSTVSELDPPFGSPDEATTVTISGTNFVAGSKVRLMSGGPYQVGRYVVDGNTDAYKTALDGDIAAVAYFDNLEKLGGLHLVDISDPTNPVRVGNFVTVDVGVDVVCSENHAFTLTLNPYTFVPGMRVVNIDDPDDPQEVGKWFSEGFPRDLIVHNGVAYVAKAWGGLSIVDVSDPTLPVEASSLNAPAGEISGVAALDGYVLVAAGTDGLFVFDVTDIANPVEVAHLPAIGGFTLGLAVRGDTAYVVDPTTGLQVLDITDPTAPILRDTLSTAGSPSDLFLQDDLLYVADGPGGLVIYDISDPRFPQRIGGFGRPGNEGFAGGVVVRDGLAYTTNFFIGMNIIDVSQPSAPPLVASFDTAGAASDIVDKGTTAFVAMSTAGLFSYDVSDPTLPMVIGSAPSIRSADSVSLDGDLAFVAIGTSGVQIFDVSNPAQPTAIGHFNTRGSTKGITPRGGLAYVADGRRGLVILDISDPAAPVQLGDYNSPGDSARVVLDGNIAYLADGNRGLQVVDVSDPASPTRIGGFDTAGRTLDVLLDGNLAYLADDFGGVRILDVSDLTAPQLLRTVVTPGSAARLRLDGTQLIVADKSGGVTVLDVSEPMYSYVSSQFDTPGSTEGMIAVGDKLLVSDGAGGLHLVGLNPPIADVQMLSGDALRATIPAGMTPGPYDVSIVINGEVGEAKRNGFLVCDATTLQTRLEPIFDPNSNFVSVPLDWNVVLEDASGPASVALTLPDLGDVTLVRKVVDLEAELDTIELAFLDSGAEITGVITLTGADPDQLEQIWNEAVAAGGFALPMVSEGVYGPVKLASVEVSNVRTSATLEDGSRATLPVSHRYELHNGVLTLARTMGDGADHRIEAVAVSNGACPASSELFYGAELRDRCFELLADNPQLIALCGDGAVLLPGTSGGGYDGYGTVSPPVTTRPLPGTTAGPRPARMLRQR